MGQSESKLHFRQFVVGITQERNLEMSVESSITSDVFELTDTVEEVYSMIPREDIHILLHKYPERLKKLLRMVR